MHHYPRRRLEATQKIGKDGGVEVPLSTVVTNTFVRLNSEAFDRDGYCKIMQPLTTRGLVAEELVKHVFLNDEIKRYPNRASPLTLARKQLASDLDVESSRHCPRGQRLHL